jgi:hypothetical protein
MRLGVQSTAEMFSRRPPNDRHHLACKTASEPSNIEPCITDSHTVAYINPEGSVTSLAFARWGLIFFLVILRRRAHIRTRLTTMIDRCHRTIGGARPHIETYGSRRRVEDENEHALGMSSIDCPKLSRRLLRESFDASGYGRFNVAYLPRDGWPVTVILGPHARRTVVHREKSI